MSSLPKKRIEVKEGVFNVLADKKDYLEGWDEYLMRLFKNQNTEGNNDT